MNELSRRVARLEKRRASRFAGFAGYEHPPLSPQEQVERGAAVLAILHEALGHDGMVAFLVERGLPVEEARAFVAAAETPPEQ